MNLVLEGIHTVRARTWTFKKKHEGGFFLSITLVTEGGPPGLEVGKVSWTLFFDSRQAETSLRALRELGWTGEDPTECLDNGGNLDRNAVQVVVTHKTRGENTFAVVHRILFPDEEMRRELKEFFQDMRVPPVRKDSGSGGAGGPSRNNL
jgi:hypothetical protein